MIQTTSKSKSMVRVGNGEVSQLPLSNEEIVSPPGGQLLAAMQRNWWMVAICLVAAIATGLFYLSRTPPIFESSATIMIGDNPVKYIPGMPTIFNHDENYLPSQEKLIESTPVLTMALESPLMEKIAADKGPDAVDFLKGRSEALADHTTNSIKITVHDTDANEGALIANGIVDGYIAYKDQENKTVSTDVLGILENDRKKCADDLSGRQATLQNFLKENVALSKEADNRDLTEHELIAISESLSRSQIDESKLQMSLKDAMDAGKTPDSIHNFVQNLRETGALPTDPAVQEARQHQQDLQQELDRDLQSGLLPSNQTVQSLQQQIAAINIAELQDEADGTQYTAYVSNLNKMVTDASQEVGLFQTQYDNKQSDLSKLGLDLGAFNREKESYENDVQRAEKLYDDADSRLKNISIDSNSGADTIQVMEPAVALFVPVSPIKWQVMALSIGLGLIVGIGNVLLYDMFDRKLRTTYDITSNLRVPIVAVIPHMIGHYTPATAGQEVRLNPLSVVSEAFRTLRTALHFSLGDLEVKTLVVTSPMPGDGKSTVVANLAIALAEGGWRVLVMDTDFRKPTQHEIFSVSNEIGLANVVTGKVKLQDAISPTDLTGLDILPSGPLLTRLPSCLDGKPLGTVLGEARRLYDFVLLDSAPVWSVADALVLGAMCDGTLLVLKAGKSTLSHSIEARDRLLRVGSRLLGAVANDIKGSRSDYYYAGYGAPNSLARTQKGL